MISISDVIQQLAVPEVNEMISHCSSDIDTVADVLEIDRNYLSVQVRLHLPYYEPGSIRECTDASIVRDILRRLRVSLDSFGAYNRDHRKMNGIDTLPLDAKIKGRAQLSVMRGGDRVASVRFGAVDPQVGRGIQERLHYIHKAREDTRYHSGLFLDGFEEPICYSAFSQLDRAYLLRALEAKDMLSGIDTDREIAVMTRAFGFNPLPLNAMSKLFDRACGQLYDDGYRLVVTAVNPFLSFRGSIFSGSSFVPFATSPMRYWFASDGKYLNRRMSEGAQPQRFPTPPILWLVRGLDRHMHKRVDCLSAPLYTVSMEEYANG